MHTRLNLQIILSLLGLLCCWLGTASAQVSISSPSAGNDVVVPSADDYASEVLGNPWDMDSEQDLADYFSQETGAPIINQSFTNGFFAFDITSIDSAYFHMLSPGICSANQGKTGQRFPIDTNKYRYLNIRMYSETADEMHVLWYTTCAGPGVKYRRTEGIEIRPGWRTYTIDLQTVGYAQNGNGETRSWSQAGYAIGLRIDPGGGGASTSAPLQRYIDWITLASAPPASSAEVDYSVAPQGVETRYSLALDVDGNPFNGVTKWLVNDGDANIGSTSVGVDGAGMHPGPNDVVGYTSGDWRTLNFGDPWNFDSSTDVLTTANLTGSVSNGAFVGRTTATQARVSLNLFGNSFSGSAYNQVCLDIYSASAGTACILSSDGGNQCFTVNQGRHTYAEDLSGIWSGKTISTLAILPVNQASVDFTLYWVALQRSGCPASDTLPTVTSATGSVIVNNPPDLKILQPDHKGGLDFASSILGNPWNMDDSNDIKSVANASAAMLLPNNNKYGRQGDFLCVSTLTGSNDTYHPVLDELVNSPLSIPSRFKNVSISFYVNRVLTETSGHTLRIIPCNYARDGVGSCLNGDDTFYTGLRWIDLTQDMKTWQLEEELHPNPPAPIWDGSFNQFRIDIIENYEATDYCIDRVEVREDDRADSKFLLTYALDDEDTNPTSVSVSFYYTTVKGAVSGGTPIAGAQNLPLDRDSRAVEFNTTGLSSGTYYIYGIATDGMNTRAVASSGALEVNHPAGQDSVDPIMEVSQPTEGRTVYSSSGAVVSGYAYDDVQLALVEVLVDGDLLKSFVPSLFDKTARTAHPSYADASNAGFFETVSLAGISVGAHSMTLRACDTNANCVEETRGIVVAGGNDPSPVQAPGAENENPLSLLTKVPSVRASVSKKGALTIYVDDTDQCASSIHISAALTKAEVLANSGRRLISIAPAGRPTLAIKSKKALRRMQVANVNQAAVFLGAACGSDAPATTKKLSLKKLSSGKLVKRNSYPKYLGKNLREG